PPSDGSRKDERAMSGRALAALTIAFCAAVAASAQRGGSPFAPANFIKIDAPVVALTHARAIDGTGAPPRDNQTLVIRDGAIASFGDADRVQPPAGSIVIDLAGKTIL